MCFAQNDNRKAHGAPSVISNEFLRYMRLAGLCISESVVKTYVSCCHQSFGSVLFHFRWLISVWSIEKTRGLYLFK